MRPLSWGIATTIAITITIAVFSVIRIAHADRLRERACQWGASSIQYINGKTSKPATSGCVPRR